MAGSNVLPSSPADQQALQGMVKEMANCLHRIEDEQQQMKDIIDTSKEKYDMEPKHMRRLAKALHKHNFPDVQAEYEEFELLYETIVEGRKTND